ncbi:MAG: fibronectin type III domain-containing protein [Armatimonadetes bacterium]|nr:fibronectin type III domain-containing protein [Armatimonadota bacterium]
MSKVKLHLQNLPIAEKLALARRILAKIKNNPDLPQAQALVAPTEAEVDALEAAETKVQGSRQQAIADTLARDAQETKTDQVLRVMGEAVEKETGGDAAKIHGAGLETAAEKSAIGPLSAPAHLAVTQGDEDGELSVSCDKVRGASSYLWEVTEDATGKSGWRGAGVSTKSHHELQGLTSGVRYHVRVAAIGAAGQSPFSDAIAKVAP